MKKGLPLNSMTILACYGYESYNDAIASSKLYVNDIVALIDKISINGLPFKKAFLDLQVKVSCVRIILMH